MGILTIGIVTKPFGFEGKTKAANAEEGVKKMKEAVDTLIVIPNDKIFNVIDKKTTFKQAFLMIDKILYLGVQGISQAIVNGTNGGLNIDFSDVTRVMKNSGNALLGIGYGAGEKRAVDAARQAIENPLLETNLDGAKKAIVAFSGGYDLTPTEVMEAIETVISKILDPEVDLIWGLTFDESFEDEIKVTIIATGFEEQSKESVLKTPARNFLGQKIEPKADSENYITRGLRNTETKMDSESLQEPEEDTEVPAFLRRQMKQQG